MIKRHLIPSRVHSNQDVINTYEVLKENSLSSLRIGKGGINFFHFGRGFCLLLARHKFLDADYENGLKELEDYLDSTIAHYSTVFSEKESVEVKIRGEYFLVDKMEESYGTEPYFWLLSFSISLILNDLEAQDKLNYYYKYKMIGSDTRYYRYCIQYLIVFFSKEQLNLVLIFERLKNLKNEVVEKNKTLTIDIERDGIGVDTIFVKIFFPVIEIYHAIFRNDEEEFNKLLDSYLREKKRWIEKNKLNYDSNFWFDYYLIACCSQAYDNRIPIRIVSEYIPTEIYKANRKNLDFC